MKPIAKTEWCEAPHFQYHVSGRLHVLMADGSETEVSPARYPCFRPDTTAGSSEMSRSC